MEHTAPSRCQDLPIGIERMGGKMEADRLGLETQPVELCPVGNIRHT